MLITLDSRGIIGLNFVYLCTLTLSSQWYEKRVMRLHGASFWPVELFRWKLLITLEPYDIFGLNLVY